MSLFYRFCFYSAVLLLGACGGSDSKNAADATPDTFSFQDENNAARNTMYVSNEIMVTGINVAADISTIGGEYSIDGGGFSADTSSVEDGQTVVVRLTSLNGFSAKASATLAIGGITSQFNVVTRSIPQYTDFQNADVVIGQQFFDSDAGNQGGPVDANTIRSPYGNPGVHEGVLYLSDYSNNRLLGFNSIPTENGDSADFVLGQPDFMTSNTDLSATGFLGNQTVAFDGGKMFLASYDASRILIWNSVPVSGGVPADIVLGQADFSSGDTGCGAGSFNNLESVWAAAGKLVATDAGNHRVLIWNTIPTESGVAPDVVLGQQDFTHCTQNDANNDGAEDTAPTASTLNWPAGTWTDGNRLVVLDSSNNRLLIWSTFPTTNFTAADVVLGQADFVHSASNDDDQDDVSDNSPSARTLSVPYNGVFSNGTQLFVADTDNNRVLVWNAFPTSNFAPADIVIGQSDFVHGGANDDDQDSSEDTGPSARTLSVPTGIFQEGDDKLIIADESNNRYLIYNAQ